MGLDVPSFSNGAAYGDLDNDGDLDLIVNTMNSPALVYQNQSERLENHFLKVKLKGEGANSHAVGATVEVFETMK